MFTEKQEKMVEQVIPRPLKSTEELLRDLILSTPTGSLRTQYTKLNIFNMLAQQHCQQIAKLAQQVIDNMYSVGNESQRLYCIEALNKIIKLSGAPDRREGK
jgi:hemoglobin-like flavoprotein